MNDIRLVRALRAPFPRCQRNGISPQKSIYQYSEWVGVVSVDSGTWSSWELFLRIFAEMIQSGVIECWLVDHSLCDGFFDGMFMQFKEKGWQPRITKPL